MARRVDDELVILDIASGRYFALNDVGALIWDRLEGDCTHDDLVDAVLDAYDADPKQVSLDVDDLTAELVDRGLIET